MADMDIFFDFDGKPVDSLTWAKLLADPQRVVATTHFGDIGVTTVWVGIDSTINHLLCRGCPPLIYETLVWKPHIDPPDPNTWVTSEWADETYRWPSRALATSGHWRIVAELQDRLRTESDQSR